MDLNFSKGIIHIGAHSAQEVYEGKKVLWVEPNPDYAKLLRDRGLDVLEVAISNKRSVANFYITTYDQASSLLIPLQHEVDKVIRVNTIPLKNIASDGYDTLVIDVQGAEMNVLTSGDIAKFDLVVCETSLERRYEGAPIKDEIVSYMEEQGFDLVEEIPHAVPDIIDCVFSKPTAIIICAGEGTRWNNYKGVPKHLVEIEGERLIDRTVRLINKYGLAKVYVVGKGNDPRYLVDGATYMEADLKPENFDADKFLSSENWWNKNGRTIVFYGDCYFTDEAVKTIMEFEGKDWTLFARFDKSVITGCPWGECFAQSFYPKDLERHRNALYKLVKMMRLKQLTRCGGWEHYRIMNGINPRLHKLGNGFYEINDFTDDFDYPEDLDRWLERR